MPVRFGMTTDPLPSAADADRITEALRRSGDVGLVRVANVSVMSSLRKLRSLTLRLRVDYEGPTEGAPSSLILKMGHPDGAGRPSYSNRREIAFYRDIAPALPAHVVPQCLEAVEATDTSVWHLLLEDLTDSHFIATEWPLPPTLGQCESIVQAWARFHATWWDEPRLGVSSGSWPDPDLVDRGRQRLADRFKSFADRFGEFMPPERRDLHEKFLDRVPQLLARLHSRRNLTIIHGDAHVWNCFLPGNCRSDDARLIDWEDWHIDIATHDLAYMMAIHWYPDRRRRIERRLLDVYHEKLLACGVSGYERQALCDDYRLSVLWHITRPIAQAARNLPPRVWWNNLERVHLAVDDLGCRELLAG